MRIFQGLSRVRRTGVYALIAGLVLIPLACGPASETANQGVDSFSSAPSAALGAPALPDGGKAEPIGETLDVPPDEPEIGSKVGNRVPEFTLLLADGSMVKSVDLLAANRPTFLYFFTTW